MLSAITRGVSPSIGDCKLTYMTRECIDVAVATRQHDAYRQCLEQMGVEVTQLPLLPEAPDAVFIQDTAVIVDEVVVVASMGVACRRPEVASATGPLSNYRPLRYLSPPATLEGGDVMRIGRTLYVGISGRTNRDGFEQLSLILKPYDYQVRAVEVRGCLHLSTGCSYLGRDFVLLNRAWVDASPFECFNVIEVDETELWAANTIAVGELLLVPSAFPRTRALIEAHQFQVISTDISELQKAEGALTCMSLIFNRHPASERR
jgi:dimethylargininase